MQKIRKILGAVSEKTALPNNQLLPTTPVQKMFKTLTFKQTEAAVQMFFKIGVLKNFAIFTVKHPW